MAQGDPHVGGVCLSVAHLPRNLHVLHCLDSFQYHLSEFQLPWLLPSAAFLLIIRSELTQGGLALASAPVLHVHACNRCNPSATCVR